MAKKHKNKRKISFVFSYRTRIVLGVFAIVVVVGALLAVVLLLARPQDDTVSMLTADEQASRDKRIRQGERDAAIREDASQAAQNGDTEGVIKAYESAIDSEEETARKVQLYIDQSEVFYDVGGVENAIESAKKAETLTDDKYLIADWLSRVYEDQGRYQLAAEYYKLAGEWADSPTNKTGLDKAYYDAQAARVAGLQ